MFDTFWQLCGDLPDKKGDMKNILTNICRYLMTNWGRRTTEKFGEYSWVVWKYFDKYFRYLMRKWVRGENHGENLRIFMGGVGKSSRQQFTGERQTAPAHSTFRYISPICTKLFRSLIAQNCSVCVRACVWGWARWKKMCFVVDIYPFWYWYFLDLDIGPRSRSRSRMSISIFLNIH